MTEERLTLNTYLAIVETPEFLSWQWKDLGKCVEAVGRGVPLSTGEVRMYDPNEWFPHQEKHVPPRVQAVCNMCPVRLECLSMAIYLNEKNGIWGGQPNRKIRRMRRTIMTKLRQE